MIDRHPAVIAQCAGTADVVAAVRLAREYRPVVSIRGGGHQVAGSAVCDDGLVIDLSRLKGVHVDPVARTARVIVRNRCQGCRAAVPNTPSGS